MGQLVVLGVQKRGELLLAYNCSPLCYVFHSEKMGKWVKPEVYPLFAAVGAVLGICSMQLVRNITSNPEVRVLKENRAAGVLENFEEGKKYKEHALRKLVRGKRPEVMPRINGFFSDPN